MPPMLDPVASVGLGVRSVGEFETCFWAGSSFWSCGFGRGGRREAERGPEPGRRLAWHPLAVCPSKQMTEMTDLLTCLTRLTNFIISLKERREKSERWDNDAGVRILHRNLGLLVELIHSIIERHIGL